ncbi:amino acid adenylation domain-containing protein [Geitlerinema sp. CS-897]|nr:amino acid adenylation domain-containing protein [Geitlerinema sp. CS-897]
MTDLSQRIANLSPEKQELLKRLLQKNKNRSNSSSLKIPKRERSPVANTIEHCPVSFAQQRMWFQDRLGIKSAVSNNISTFLKISGSLNVPALEASIQEIVRRHEILRTTLQNKNGELVQAIAPEIQWKLPVFDLRSLSPSQQDERVREIGIQQACQPVKLDKDWCWNVQLVRLDDTDHTLVLTLHHIAVDAWSIGVFFRELSALYGAFSQGKPSPLPELSVQYADFSNWQRQYFQGDSLDRELSYWKQTLKNAPDVLQLPSDRPRPTVQSFTGKTLSFLLPKTLVDGLKTLSQQAETTLFTTLLAGLQTLLFRYTSQEDILVGSPIANRHQPEVESLIGCFINTLVFRSDLSGNPSFRQLLDRVKKTVLGALAHQTLPFETLVDKLHLTRNIAYAPLFQVMLVLQNAFSIENIELPGLNVSHSRIDNQTAQFDLTFHLVEADIGLIGKLEYNTDLFDETTMLRLLGHFQTLLNAAIADPNTSILDLPILTPTEAQQILSKQPPTLLEIPQGCIHQLFEAQVQKTPDAIALVCGDRQLTYRDLDRQANQFARYLQKQGIQPECLVALCLERSIDLFVGLLGILKAGGAYVPLDPAYPSQRLETILSDAQPSAIVTQTSLIDQFDRTNAIALDANWNDIAAESPEPPNVPVNSDRLAYVIYTSGSTGTPKGVAVEHRSLVNFTEAASEEYDISDRDRVLQFATLGFDTAIEEIFPALTRGATLVLRSDRWLGSMSGFLNACHQHNITVLDLPTAFWHQLAADIATERLTVPDSLRLVIIGGEKALGDRLELWQNCVSPQVRLVNSYGPTEATVVTTTVEFSQLSLSQRSGRELPIGTPIRNATTYVLDPCLKPVPLGIPGELYIGGAGIARGYLNRPDLNEQTFIDDPFSSVPGARLYKTGDRVCLREDGNLEFLGRIDNQVKIRGFRIELGEIEAALNQHPDIQTSVVLDRDICEGDRQLVGYIVPNAEATPTTPQLRRFLEKRLPKYMVPAAFVTLDALPINVHGKIDRQALPAPEPANMAVTDRFVAPQTPREVAIAEIFAAVLGVDRVGRYDDFFELGGHSLLATKLLTRVSSTLQAELTLVDLFESPTVAGLVERLENRNSVTSQLDLEKEVALDAAIAAPNAEFQWVETPQQVFLTGSTGFLGAFLLAELLQNTPATVYCLVRASDETLAQQRVRRNLENYQLWNDRFSDRIVAVPGDLSQPRLGLAIAQFSDLAASIDTIYHNGALVNSVYPYSALKTINVSGTQEVLRFASQTKLKAVHFISSLSVVHSPSYLDREVVTEADGFDRWRGLFNGYAQSKWVAEQIAQIARSRGIPVCIYRPGVISGHSQTGVCNTQDFLHTLLKGFVQLQSAPDVDAVWDFTPVDYVSQAIVHLSRQPENRDKVFHLTNPKPLQLRALIEAIASFGYPLQQMAYEPWRSRLEAFVQQSHSQRWKSLLPIFPKTLSEELLQVVKLRFDCQNTLQGLKDTAIACPPVDRQLLKTYWTYLIDRGFLDSPKSL